MASTRRLEISALGKKQSYLVAGDLAALLGLVQMDALEIHPWGAQIDRIEQPDRLIFDLDPGQDVPSARVVEAARRVRDLLSDLGLASFVKTTGSKGLHLVVPLVRRKTWPEVKRFAGAVAERLAADFPSGLTGTISAHRRNWFDSAVLLEERGRVDDAIDAYRQTLRLQQTDPVLHFNPGNVLADAGRYEESAWHYGEATRLDPQYVETRNNRGVVPDELGRVEEAIEAFRRALALWPHYADTTQPRTEPGETRQKGQRPMRRVTAAQTGRWWSRKGHEPANHTRTRRVETTIWAATLIIRIRPVSA
jgi:tetratricopeptide (TPR) repeat protein